MPTYNYTAISEKGRRMKGQLYADNDIDLESRLKEIGMDLVSYNEVKQKKAGFGAKVKMKDMIIFCLHMEQLSRAGVPLHDSLADVRDSTDSLKLRDVLMDVSESVKGGTKFSDSLARHPRIFGEVFVGLIKAGETNGNLTESFTNMSDHIKWSADLKRKVRKAIAYPITLMVVMTGVITILMMFVVPKLIDFIVNQGFDIPPHTRALIATSEFFQAYWYIVLLTPIILFSIHKALFRSVPEYAYKFDAFMLRFPAIGPTVRKINLARFTHFFSVMFNSGIDILDSLTSAQDVVNNRVLKESISVVKRSVTEGNSLTASLRVSNQFPNLVIRMFKVGEDSGNMNEALENINFFYHREVNDAVDGMVALIQPTMTIVMGGIIFWVIASVFGPLYQSFQNMNF